MQHYKWFGKELIRELKKVRREALRGIGGIVKKSAKQLCPIGKIKRTGGKYWKERKPGSLQRSIRYKVMRGGHKVQIIAGNKKVFYARFVEIGTNKTSPKSFLRPAIEMNKTRIMAEFKNRL